MKIYVVSGSTGEYSDRSEWMVAAYTSETDAKRHVEKAEEYSRAWSALCRTAEIQDLDYFVQRERMKSANPMDPNFSCDYTGTSYSYGEVELLDKFTNAEAIN